MKLSILIPVYNEENTVKKMLSKVLEVSLPYGMTKELVIVDDGSFDNTCKLIKEFKKANSKNAVVEIKIFRHDRNFGKGRAVRTAIENATGEIYIIQDADLEYDPEFFIDLLRPFFLEKASVVFGTRLKNYPLKLWGKDKTPLPSHWIGNKFLTLFTNILYKSNLSDMETCYKVFRSEAVAGMNLKSDRFEIEPELTAKLIKGGNRIIEIPITTKPRSRKEGKKINWTDGFGAVWAIIKYRFKD